MTIRWKICKQLDEQFASTLALAFEHRFNYSLEVQWNIFANAMVSTRADGNGMSIAQQRFIAGFEAAWLAARNIAHG